MSARYKSIHKEKHGVNREHQLIATRALGHALPIRSVIHHVDGNKSNNANSNLVICEDLAYHNLLHKRQRVVDAGGNPEIHKICSKCKRLVNRSEFYVNISRKWRSDQLNNECKSCLKEKWTSEEYKARRRKKV